MKNYFIAKNFSVFIGVIAAALFFAVAPRAFALSYSPSTIYPGTPYTLYESVSNSNGSTISVTKDCFYWKNGVYGGSWSHEVLSVPSSGATATCSSTGDTAGSAMSFQMNIWRPNYNGSVSWGTTGFTVQSPPVASVSISGPSPVSYGGGSYLTVTPTNAYGCSVSGPGYWAYNNVWWTGSLYSDTSFTASCTASYGATGSPTASFTVRVTPPPPSTYNLSTSIASGSGSISCNGSSCASSYSANTSLTLTASPSSGYTFGGWGGACSGTGSCSLTMNTNKTVSASFVQQPFNYSLSASANISVTAGSSGSNIITRTLTSGITQSVALSASISPSTGSITLFFANNPANPSYGSALTVSTARGTPPGSYTITVTGSPLGKTTSFSLAVSPPAMPNLTASQYWIAGTKMNGQQNFEAGTTLTDVVRVTNTGGADANSLFVYLQRGTNTANMADISGATATYETLLHTTPQNAINIPVSAEFPTGTWLVRACVRHNDTPFDANGNFIDTCSGTTPVTFAPPPPPPKSACVAYVNNTITGTSDWVNNASISVAGCPSAEYQDMWVTGHSGSNEWTADLIRGVFDVDLLAWRDWNSSLDSGAADAMRTAETGCFQDVCYPGFTIGEPGVSVYGGFFGTRTYHVGDIGDTVYEKSILKRGGKYGYKTINGFNGNYVCYTENISTYNPATQTITTRDNPIKVPFSATANLMACIEQGGTGNYYKNSSCVQIDRSVGLFARANCPNGSVDIPFSPTLSIPSQPTAPSFEHKLNVQSKLNEKGGADGDGVSIKEISVVSSTNFSPNYFAGTTDYTKTAERNLTVVLEAPETHPDGGVFKSVNGWTGSCEEVSGNPRQCRVSFAFTALGGNSKTVIANYSTALTAPTVLTNTPSCDANGGKVSVYLQSAVSGATGYRIYRSASSFTAMRKNWLSVAYAQTVTELDSDKNSANGITPFSAPPTQANPYIDDKGLTPNTKYYYRAVAFNSSVSSPASAEVSRNASLPCPDLVVEQGSVEIINSSTGAVITDTTKVPSNTSIKFRAKIRNQGGATPTLPSPGFYNQFTIGTTALTPNPSLLTLGQGALSSFVNSGVWLTPTPTISSNHSLQVCADIPPAKPGTVRDESNEDNNCLASPFSFSVVTPITVQLECEQAGGTFKNDYCVIDYAQASSLKWTTSGNPTSCNWLTPPSDTSGPATSNSLSLNNLLNKLNFKYQLECTQ